MSTWHIVDTSSGIPNAIRYPAFQLFWAARTLAGLGTQIASVSVGWMIYDTTRSAFMLGLVGLVQFLPSLALVLVTGQAADRFSRRLIMLCCAVIEGCCVAAIAFWYLSGAANIWVVFAALAGFGVARAFFGPAAQSLMANVVPSHVLPSAISWSTGGWQLTTIVGPVFGGLLYGFSAPVAFTVAIVLFGISAVLPLFIIGEPKPPARDDAKWSSIAAGFHYVRSQPIVLGAITLDLFIVLLGGATALLPIVALDVLQAGPWALGLLRAAAGLGGVVTAVWLGLYPIKKNSGVILFTSVIVFGLATIVFGLSGSVVLSVLALIVIGASDMISVYIRTSIVQLAVPDHIRGRVSALNMVSVGASNEVGEFRAGSVASIIGVVPAIVLGGVGALAIASIWLNLFPSLRKRDRLEQNG